MNVKNGFRGAGAGLGLGVIMAISSGCSTPEFPQAEELRACERNGITQAFIDTRNDDIKRNFLDAEAPIVVPQANQPAKTFSAARYKACEQVIEANGKFDHSSRFEQALNISAATAAGVVVAGALGVAGIGILTSPE